MQFLTISRRRTEIHTEDEFAPMLPAEAEQARTLYAEGAVRQIWHRADLPGAVLMFEAASEDEVRRQLNRLPMVAAGLLEIVAVIPLNPYRGFGPRG